MGIRPCKGCSALQRHGQHRAGAAKCRRSKCSWRGRPNLPSVKLPGFDTFDESLPFGRCEHKRRLRWIFGVSHSDSIIFHRDLDAAPGNPDTQLRRISQSRVLGIEEWHLRSCNSLLNRAEMALCQHTFPRALSTELPCLFCGKIEANGASCSLLLHITLPFPAHLPSFDGEVIQFTLMAWCSDAPRAAWQPDHKLPNYLLGRAANAPASLSRKLRFCWVLTALTCPVSSDFAGNRDFA